jgi:hypothetical protein
MASRDASRITSDVSWIMYDMPSVRGSLILRRHFARHNSGSTFGPQPPPRRCR